MNPVTETPDRQNGDEITVQVFKDSTSLEALRGFWSTACCHPDVDLDFFQRVILTRPVVIMPFVLAATRGSQPISLLVGRLENGRASLKVGRRNLLQLHFRELVYVYEGFLGDRSEVIAQAFIREILGRLKAGEAGAARIANLTDDCAMRQFALGLPALPLRDHAWERTEHWKGAVPGTVEAFIASRGKNTRRDIRNKLNRFNRDFQGRFRFESYHQASDIPRFCADAEQVARHTYQRAMGVGFCNGAEDHHRLQVAAQKGWWLAYVLFVDGRPVSFVSARVLGELMIWDWMAYSPALQHYRVGIIVGLRLIEHGCEIGVRELDFGIGPGTHKETLLDRNEPKSTVRIYAPCLMGLGAATLHTTIVLAKRAARFALVKLALLGKIKKLWRAKLAASDPAAASTTKGQE